MSKSHEWLWEGLEKHLAKSQLKNSKQRNVIIEYFLEMDGHVAADDLHQFVKSKGVNVGHATVYRTLNLMKDAGLVTQKQFSDSKSIFELNSPDSHHDHLFCLNCHKVVEFENEEIEELQKQVAEKFGFKLTAHNLDLYGYCSDCK